MYTSHLHICVVKNHVDERGQAKFKMASNLVGKATCPFIYNCYYPLILELVLWLGLVLMIILNFKPFRVGIINYIEK